MRKSKGGVYESVLKGGKRREMRQLYFNWKKNDIQWVYVTLISSELNHSILEIQKVYISEVSGNSWFTRPHPSLRLYKLWGLLRKEDFLTFRAAYKTCRDLRASRFHEKDLTHTGLVLLWRTCLLDICALMSSHSLLP